MFKDKNCYLLATFRRPAEFNMDLDRRMLENVSRLGRDQIWRIYSWNPPAISVGKNQVVENILDFSSLSQAGVTVVKRPTGGRAIYHKNDICISVAGLLDCRPAAGSSAGRIYSWFAGVLGSFFENLNIKTVFARGQRLAGEFRSGTGKLPCFLSATPYELLASGKKIAGIALFIGKDRFLVQSSLRVNRYSLDDFTFFKGMTGSAGILENITSIGEESGRVYEEQELHRVLREALSDEYNLNIKNMDEGDFLDDC